MARTQQERREATVAGILGASIDTIIEVGYARTTSALIAKRAHVSDGAIFRHFPTMREVMTATLREAWRRQLDLFMSHIADMPADARTPEAVLRVVRDITHNPTNGVIYELLVAARTDEKLRAMLKDEIRRYQKAIFDAAGSLPAADGLDAQSRQHFQAMVVVLINAFDGAAIFKDVLPATEAIDERRINVLASLLSPASLLDQLPAKASRNSSET